MSFLEERNLGWVGRDARRWLLDDRDLARRGREAREWLTHDERGRVIGLVVFSVAISIFMSLMATAIVGFVSRRRAATPNAATPEVTGEPLAAVEALVSGPVMDAAEPLPVEAHIEA